MKQILGICVISIGILLGACAGGQQAAPISAGHQTINATQARELMEDGQPFILVDVRTQEEQDTGGWIEGAILIPAQQIGALASELLPDLDARILIYCHSGRRSATAAQVLADMGYAAVYDFGGILSWPYDIMFTEGREHYIYAQRLAAKAATGS